MFLFCPKLHIKVKTLAIFDTNWASIDIHYIICISCRFLNEQIRSRSIGSYTVHLLECEMKIIKWTHCVWMHLLSRLQCDIHFHITIGICFCLISFHSSRAGKKEKKSIFVKYQNLRQIMNEHILIFWPRFYILVLGITFFFRSHLLFPFPFWTFILFTFVLNLFKIHLNFVWNSFEIRFKFILNSFWIRFKFICNLFLISF